MQITPSPFILDSELTVTFIRSSGPGGQNVNKVATAVRLRFDVRNSPSLAEDVKARLVKLAGAKMTRDGVLLIEVKRYRTQERNRADAELRLASLLQKALIKPKKRQPTRPTKASLMRRMESKKHRGLVKRIRQSKKEHEE